MGELRGARFTELWGEDIAEHLRSLTMPESAHEPEGERESEGGAMAPPAGVVRS